MEILQAQTFNQALCSNFNKAFSGNVTTRGADADEQTILNLQNKLDEVTFKYNAVFNSSDNYCIILDRHLNVVDFNDASILLVKQVFGKRLTVGQHMGSYLTGPLYEPLMNNCMRALGGESFIVEREVIFGNNNCTWWQARYSPAYNDKQHIAGIIFNANDITNRKARDFEIEKQTQKLRDISLMQSHEIRGPVCTLMGLINLLKIEGATDTAGYLQRMEATVNLLDKKIRAIVDCASEPG